MPDPITTLGLAKTTSDIIKEAMDFARVAKNSELAEKLVDLYRDFLLLVETNQELRNEIQQLKTDIAELKKRPDVASKLRYVKAFGSYHLRRDDGTEDGPFCGVCWDIDGRLVRQSGGSLGQPTMCGFCVRRNSKR